MSHPPPAERTRYLVDGMNVIGCRPDGWWRDRPAARRHLVEEIASLFAVDHPVTVIFDGHPTAGEVEAGLGAGVDVRFSPGGPNAADDTIVELVRGDPTPTTMTVVTSDRGLIARILDTDATVVGSKQFRKSLTAPSSDSGP